MTEQPPLLAVSPLLNSALDQLRLEGAIFFRSELTRLGFDILPGTHPITSIMIGDAGLATRFADAMLAHGVYVVRISSTRANCTFKLIKL